jgi:hypothetical protein
VRIETLSIQIHQEDVHQDQKILLGDMEQITVIELGGSTTKLEFGQ